MIVLTDLLYDTIFHPEKAMEEIAERKPVVPAVLIVIMSFVLPWMVYIGSIQQNFGFTHVALIVAGLQGFINVLWWFCSAAIWNLVAEIYGAKANAKSLLVALGFAQLPYIVGIPFLVGIFLFSGVSGWIQWGIIWIIMEIWSFTLTILAIKQIYLVSNTKAVGIYFSPLFLLVILAILGFFLLNFFVFAQFV